MNFFEKLTQRIISNDTLLILGLDPNPEMMPQDQNTHQGQQSLIIALETWLKWVVEQTAELVCAYKPTLGFYEALGSDGLDLLLKVIQAIPDDIPIILDAKHGDLNTSTLFAQTIFERWQVDAVTVSPYAGQDQVAPFLVYPDQGVFVLCHTSNPSAVILQEYPTDEAPFLFTGYQRSQNLGNPRTVIFRSRNY